MAGFGPYASRFQETERAYILPGWFASCNVKSPLYFQSTASKIVPVREQDVFHHQNTAESDDTTESEDTRRTLSSYGVREPQFTAILDRLASTFVSDIHANLRRDKHGIILRSESPYGEEFLNEYVAALAKDVHVTVELEDLVELASDYDRQSRQTSKTLKINAYFFPGK